MPSSTAAKPPIFILGVPRSGTTLLRTILDSHPAIACGPETPWLGGHQPRSVMELWRFLRDDRHGYAASYGMPRGVVTAAAREFVARLMGEYAASKGKARWAEKTPDNVLYADFLLELFPEAKVVHLVRDGLDVAMSTSVVAEHRKGISGFLERNLGFGPGVPAAENNPFTALVRWSHWNRLVGRSLTGKPHLRLSYERLVSDPGSTLRELMAFVGEPYEPSMLDYARTPHDYPNWEWGSADVKAKAGITTDRVGRGERELSAPQLALLRPLVNWDRREPSPLPGELDPRTVQERAAAFEPWLRGLAIPMGFGSGVALQELAWAWAAGLSGARWEGCRMIDIGGLTALPWIAALLGASVTIVHGADQPDPAALRLRDALRLRMQWRRFDGQRLPADLQTARIVSDFQGEPRTALPAPADLGRLVEPGGLIAIARETDANRLRAELSGGLGPGLDAVHVAVRQTGPLIAAVAARPG